MAAPSLTTLSISWAPDGPKILVMFTPHSDFSRRRPVVRLTLDWQLVPDSMYEATVVALRAAADSLESDLPTRER